MIDIAAVLQDALRESGSLLTATGLREAFSATSKEIREDSLAHGESGDAPFWDLVSDERTHAFSVFAPDRFELFLASGGDFQDLVGRLNMLAMIDVDELRQLLVQTFGLERPLISVDRSVAEFWFGT